MQILVDTNFWLIPFTCRVDIVREFHKIHPHAKLLTMQGTLRELEFLPREKGAAKHALALIRALNVTILESSDADVDDQIVDYATKNDVVVATQDRELKRRVKVVGRKILFLRKKQYVEMT